MSSEIKPYTPYRGGLENVKEFDRRHGECSVVVGGERLYPNGARRDVEPLGVMIEPPESDFQCLKLKVRYWQTLVDEAVQVFYDAKRDLLQAAKGLSDRGFGPPELEEETTKLEQLQTIVKGRKRHLEEAKAELEKTPEAQRARQAEIQAAENRASCAEFIDVIKTFQV